GLRLLPPCPDHLSDQVDECGVGKEVAIIREKSDQGCASQQGHVEIALIIPRDGQTGADEPQGAYVPAHYVILQLHSGPAAIFRGSRLGQRSEEHTSELQSRENLVCCLLLEKKKSISIMSL